jgi:hypothetical protein
MEEELKRASHWPRRGGDCHQQGVRGWELPIRAAQEKAASADSNRAEGPLPFLPSCRSCRSCARRSSIEMVIHRQTAIDAKCGDGKRCYSVSCHNSFKTAIPNKAEILQQYLRQTVSLKWQYVITIQTTRVEAAI